MKKFVSAWSLPVTLGLSATLNFAAAQPVPTGVRVVPCDQPVKSTKRGVCVNNMDAKDFMALSPSVSWWYNWHFTNTLDAPKEANMEFLPMAWGASPDALSGLKTYLTRHKPGHVLALNEPNLKGQAFITPEQSADFYKQVKAAADTYNIPVVGPHMALGSGTADSVKAMDPIDKKEVTYTFMVPFVKAFLNYTGNTDVSAVAAHSYGNFGELNWMTGMLHDTFQRPVWVTEFAQWNAASPEAERDYMIQSVDLFERTPYVKGYAWFKERVKDNAKISLLDKDSGKLTMVGEAYVNMPVHDPQVYYRLPGRLQAESYLEMQKPNIGLTKDGEGFLEVMPDGDTWIDYNVAVERAGQFSVTIRCKAAVGTKFDILSGTTVLGSAQATGDEWQTLTASIVLPKGNQTIRIRPSAYAHLNWMEFGAQ
ncbi:hypothetical protein IAD21_04815 [Abditibacteriota bacterium]|nr:hypothetical protein IAD21_04815 [Abditibacteriota bacterium]